MPGHPFLGHRQSQGKAHPQKSDAERWKARGEHRTATTSECQPEGTEELGPKTTRHTHLSPPVGLMVLLILPREARTWNRRVCGKAQGCERRPNVRFGSKADILPKERDVRFTPESGHS